MSDNKSVSRTYICKVQPPSKCEFCGLKKELRPYGPKGESVCFQCAMKDEKAMKKQFEKLFT